MNVVCAKHFHHSGKNSEPDRTNDNETKGGSESRERFPRERRGRGRGGFGRGGRRGGGPPRRYGSCKKSTLTMYYSFGDIVYHSDVCSLKFSIFCVRYPDQICCL